jgi:hypothetical protein
VVFGTPIKFDGNELWVLAGLIVLSFIFFKLPRHFPPALTFVLMLFNANLSICVDFILASKYPFNFYDALDTQQYDLFDFIMDTINYTIYGYLFMYSYDKLRLQGTRNFLLILGWIGLSLLLEWMSIKLNVFKFIHWNLGFSTIAYTFIFTSYIIFLKIGKIAFQRYKTSRINKNTLH